MSARVLHTRGGRVLVVGAPDASDTLLSRLSAEGYEVVQVDRSQALSQAARSLKPEAVVLTASAATSAMLSTIRRSEALREVPVLGYLDGDVSELRKLELDDFIGSSGELSGRIEAALRARRLIARDEERSARMEALLEVTQAASSSLELDEILRLAVEKVGRVLGAERCSVVLVEGGGPRTAHVVASREHPQTSNIEVDLARYPELRRAFESRRPVYVDDAGSDPLLSDVRQHLSGLEGKSILVQPLLAQEDVLGALFLRLSKSDDTFDREDREFAAAVAGAIANSVRNARMHTALRRKRDDLESAYVDRYRELTEANQRLKELNRVKDEIIAVVSHDLRAPLQVLLGHGRILVDAATDASNKMSAEAIVRQGRKILGLVESLLERGKGEQARVSIEPSLLDVAELCKETADDLSILARDRSIQLRAETPESLMVLGDEVKLREVLQNLISNAIQHAKTQVTVFSQRVKRPDGDAVRVLVRDDGPGIAKEQLHLVFDKYRHGPGGIGLGLSICKEFIELHGGEIWADAAEGGGTQFVFTLPLAQKKPVQRKEFLVQPAPQEESPRVLVVEDEPEIAAVLAEILRSRYRVEVARDGAEGLAKGKALQPDLIVMDVFLPKLDGLDAAMALKSSPDTAGIPVILLSAHKGVAEKVRALNLGAVDYMHKPFQALELLTRTERALTLRRAEKELERSLSLLRRTGNDPETGLFDRTGVQTRLEQELARSRRYGRALTVGMLRPEKPLGEKARPCALLIRAKLRTPDVVGHFGQGALGVILPECPTEQARKVLQRLLPELEQTAGMRFTIAVVDGMQPGVDAETLVDQLLAQK